MDLNAIVRALSKSDEAQIKSLMAFATNGYQIYNPFVDPIALEPGGTTDSKAKLFQFTRKDFEGKSVSDLGCNLGAFSFLALNYGATKVFSYEKEPDFQHFLNLIIENYCERFPQYDGKIKVVRSDLVSLPSIQKTDVLLAVAIIHWFFVSSPNITMAEIAKWLNDSCNDAVYFEGCVTASEPVMQAYKVDVNRYYEKLFLDEMSKYFTPVILGRPSYNPNRLSAKFYKK